MICKKPKLFPPTDLRGKEKNRNGQLRDRVEVTYAVSYTYNGGISRLDGNWYPGVEVPPPILPDGYKLVGLGVGLQLNATPPYATALLVKQEAQGK